MTEPIWIHCASVADVDPERLAAQARGGRHIILRLTLLRPDEVEALIGRLSAALPEHHVFDNGYGSIPTEVTIIPTVARARVLDRRAEVLRAIADYHHSCATLVEQYRAGALSGEWWSDEHGEHCQFTNRRTGQVVEAPLAECTNPDLVDPYFFALFVKTTAGLESVAELIEHDFHDAARILDIMAAERG